MEYPGEYIEDREFEFALVLVFEVCTEVVIGIKKKIAPSPFLTLFSSALGPATIPFSLLLI